MRLSAAMQVSILSGLRSKAEFVATVGQDALPDLPAHCRPDVQMRDWPCEPDPTASLHFYRDLLAGLRITHALVCQPLLWYSDQVATACAEAGVRLTWCEQCLDGKVGFDSQGGQYTERNDLTYDSLFPASAPAAFATKHPQPDHVSLGRDEDALVVWGQLPWDMSLMAHHGTPYKQWMDAALAQPGRVLYKRHPLLSPDEDPVVVPSSAEVISAHVDDLLALTPWHAAFSSTVILEGLAQGCFFATGGRHFADDWRWVVSGPPTDKLLERMRYQASCRIARDEASLARRISFVRNEWMLPGDDPRVFARVRDDADTYFKAQSLVRGTARHA